MNNKRSKISDSEESIFTSISSLSNKYNAINLGQGFPNFDCSEKLKELVNHYLQNGKNQYTHMAGLDSLRNQICHIKTQLYNRPLNGLKNICITAGATQAIFTAICAFVHAGDEVIIIEPAYDSYRPSIEVAGGIVIAYELKTPNFEIVWDEFRKLITSKTRMIIINTPHNPTGTVFHKSDLLQLEEIIKEHDIVLLSDEVYHHIIFDKTLHESAMKYPALFEKTISIFSFGKTFHATGWKIGYCIGPEKLINQFKTIHQWNVFCVNSFIQYALADFLKDENNYLNLSSFYQKKRDLMTQTFSKTRLKAIPSKGTYFQLYDYSKICDLDDFEFAKQLVVEYGVASIPISPFYKSKYQNKVVRFCFAKTDDTILEAGQRLMKL